MRQQAESVEELAQQEAGVELALGDEWVRFGTEVLLQRRRADRRGLVVGVPAERAEGALHQVAPRLGEAAVEHAEEALEVQQAAAALAPRRVHAAGVEASLLLHLPQGDARLLAGLAELVDVEKVVDVVIRGVEVLHHVHRGAHAARRNVPAHAREDVADLHGRVDGVVRDAGGQRVRLPVVQARTALRRQAGGRARKGGAALDGAVWRLVQVPDALHDAAEEHVGVETTAGELPVVFVLLPSDEVRRVGALPAAVGDAVPEGVGELVEDLVRLPGAVAHLRVAGGVVHAHDLVDVDEALGVRVQTPEGPADHLAAVGGQRVVLKGLQEVVVSDLPRAERLLEELEEVTDLHFMHQAAGLGGEHLGDDALEFVGPDGAGVLRILLPEGGGEADQRARALAADEGLHAQQDLLGPLPLLVRGRLRAQRHAGAALADRAASKVGGEELVLQGAVPRVAVEDHLHVLVGDARGEGDERALKLPQVDEAGVSKVVEPASLHDEGILAHARWHPLLDLAEDHLLQLVELGLWAAQSAPGVAGVAAARHRLRGFGR
mmetsp:Transcript_8351/g.23843  ORF Transcript_8351/g.23843 Transcript_8351/m.23843 type:complete len:550 (+) Transcript_8351:275-1924(+)